MSSSVTMLVPFCIGKLIDMIYNSTEDFTDMLWNLKLTCAGLSVVFLLGALANLGRVYLVQTTGNFQCPSLSVFTLWFFIFKLNLCCRDCQCGAITSIFVSLVSSSFALVVAMSLLTLSLHHLFDLLPQFIFSTFSFLNT